VFEQFRNVEYLEAALKPVLKALLDNADQLEALLSYETWLDKKKGSEFLRFLGDVWAGAIVLVASIATVVTHPPHGQAGVFLSILVTLAAVGLLWVMLQVRNARHRFERAIRAASNLRTN
jgi:hypothetical protein